MIERAALGARTFVEAKASAPFIGGDLVVVVGVAVVQERLNAVFENFERADKASQFLVVDGTANVNIVASRTCEHSFATYLS